MDDHDPGTQIQITPNARFEQFCEVFIGTDKENHKPNCFSNTLVETSEVVYTKVGEPLQASDEILWQS